MTTLSPPPAAAVLIACLLLACLLSSSAFAPVPAAVAGSHVRRSLPVMMAGFGAPKVSEEAKIDPTSPCLCKSGKAYSECCQPYHASKALPATVTAMVRSRFSALRYKLIPYLVETTHPEHKEWVDSNEQASKYKAWLRGLKEFAAEYEFLDLVFDDEERDSAAANLATSPDGTVATVSFVAKLQKSELGERTPESLVETSDFLKTNGRWLYRDAVTNNPFKNRQAELSPKKTKFITTAKRGVPKGN